MTRYLAHATQADNFQPHVGLCLSDEIASVISYAPSGTLYVFELSGANVVDVDGGWDHDSVVAVGDDGDFSAYGNADAICYDDSDMNGRDHETIRIASAAGVTALRLVKVLDLSDPDVEDMIEDIDDARELAE